MPGKRIAKPKRRDIVDWYRHLTKTRDVAEVTGVSQSTVIRVLHAARARMRRIGRPTNPDRDPTLRYRP